MILNLFIYATSLKNVINYIKKDLIILSLKRVSNMIKLISNFLIEAHGNINKLDKISQAMIYLNGFKTRRW